MTALEKMKKLAAVESKILIKKTGKLNYGRYHNTAGTRYPALRRQAEEARVS